MDCRDSLSCALIKHLIKIVLLALSLCTSSTINAQISIDDTVRIYDNLNLAQEIYLEEPERAKTLWEQALTMTNDLLKQQWSNEVKEELQVVKSDLLFNLSQIYRNSGDPEMTIYYLNQALEIDEALGNKENMSYSYNDLGVIYNDVGLFDKALEYYMASLSIDKELKNMQGVATSLGNLGYLHTSQENYDEAIAFFKEALEIQQKQNDSLGMVVSYNNLASVYFTIDEYETAMEYSQKSQLIASNIHAIASQANATARIGNIHLEMNRLDKAEEYFNEALALRQSIGEKDGIFTSYIELSKLYNSKNKTSEAIAYAELGLGIAKETGFPVHLSEASEQLSTLYKAQGKFQRALEMLQFHIEISNQIIQKDRSKSLFKKQYEEKYNTLRMRDSLIAAEQQAKAQAIKEREDYERKIEEQEFKNQQKKNQIYIIASIGGFVLMAFVIIILYRNNKQKQLANQLIEEQKKAVEKQKSKIEDQHKQLETNHKEISDSINYAERLQHAILPSSESIQSAFSDGFVLYMPKHVVSGDFYWLNTIDNLHLIAVADCTGHGVPGAMVSVVCSNALNSAVKEHGLLNPADILNKTREIVIDTFASSGKEVRDGMDISLLSVESKDNSSFNIKYSGANNPLWVIEKGTTQLSENKKIRKNIIDDYSISDIRGDRQPIGLYSQMSPFTQVEFTLNKGAKLYMSSDGYIDQFGGPNGKKLKSPKLKKWLIEQQEISSMEEHVKLLKQLHLDWRGNFEQIDDICVLGIKL